jgi:hypothetical protein
MLINAILFERNCSIGECDVPRGFRQSAPATLTDTHIPGMTLSTNNHAIRVLMQRLGFVHEMIELVMSSLHHYSSHYRVIFTAYGELDWCSLKRKKILY